MIRGIFSRAKKQSVANPDCSENTQLAVELRESVIGSHRNVAILAALMAGRASLLYTSPSPGKCFGENVVFAEHVISLMGMVMLTFGVIVSVILLMDIEGVPTDMLLQHLIDSQTLYSLPHGVTALGIFLTAIAYGIDIVERGGCKAFILGAIVGPLAVSAMIALAFVCQYRRKKLFEKQGKMSGGTPLFATWADRIPTVKISTENEIISSSEVDQVTAVATNTEDEVLSDGSDA
eukprot:scaffold185525_cov40-Cyclotella_meneghiniana.AAC.1